MRKTVVLDGYVANDGDLSWSGIEELGNLTVYERTSPAEIVDRAAGADAVFTNKVVLTDEIMEQLPDLKFIGVLATGYNNVDIEAARRRGITVCNVPAYSTESVVQTVFAHLLNIVNRVAAHSASVKRGDWQFCNDFSYRLGPIDELSGSTMGIYGLGHIGMRVAEVAHAFGMKVIALTSKTAGNLPAYIEKVDRDGLFMRSDVLSLNAPLTADNALFVNSVTLSLMKPGAILINTARGGLIDENALAEALDRGMVHAAGVDVLSVEPPVNGDVLIDNERCEVTPHIAWQSTQARRRLLEVSTQNLRQLLAGTPQNVVV